MNNYYDKLFADLSADLYENTEKEVSIKKTWEGVGAVADALKKIKERITQYPFKTTAEEILFFKQEKPRFLAEQLFALEMVNVQTSRPLYDAENLKTFYQNELSGPGRFFSQYKAMYQYYQLDATDLDELLFIRGAKPPSMLLPETQNLDPAFSTNGDYAFAKFIAMERLQAYLIEELKELNRPGRRLYNGLGWQHVDDNHLKSGGEMNHGPSKLSWTGESINLVELAYGMWLTGQINNGNASVSEIVEFLEKCFQVEIGTPHRRWQSISRRKRIAPFKYVDEIKAALSKRLEEEWGK